VTTRNREDGLTSHHRVTSMHAFYGARVDEFIAAAPDAVVGTLTTRAALEFRANQPEQARAWRDQVGLLRNACNKVAGADDWGLLLEGGQGGNGDVAPIIRFWLNQERISSPTASATPVRRSSCVKRCVRRDMAEVSGFGPDPA